MSLIKLVIEEGEGVVSEALQEAACHLHDQGILVSHYNPMIVGKPFAATAHYAWQVSNAEASTASAN